MGATKIVDEEEVLRWFEEGRTYAWMVEEYRRKYNIETAPSLWGNFRRRRGIPRRITRSHRLIPWPVKAEHRWEHPVMMLRMEARRREGKPQSDAAVHKVTTWAENLRRDGMVVHYDPDTEEGFFYVPKRDGIDNDLIREPIPEQRRRRRMGGAHDDEG